MRGKSSGRGRGKEEKGRGSGRSLPVQGGKGYTPSARVDTEVLSNSLRTNIGKSGYNSDGVKTLDALSGKLIYMPEVFRTFELWCGESGWDLVMGMFQNPQFYFETFEEPPVVDMERFVVDPIYRIVKESEIKSRPKMRQLVKAQSTQAFTYLYGLMGQDILMKVMMDDDWEFVFSHKNVGHLMVIIVEAASTLHAVEVFSSREALRSEWSVFRMSYYSNPLNVYLDRMQDLLRRSGVGQLIYTAQEQAYKFTAGLSARFDTHKTNVWAMSPIMQPQSLDLAYKAAYEWENAQKMVFGDKHAVPSVSSYAAFAVSVDATEGRNKYNTRNKKWKSDADEKKESDGKKKIYKWTEDGKPICSVCEGKGHKAYECPSAKSVNALYVCSNSSVDVSRLIMLDSGAEASMFMRSDIVSDLQSIDDVRMYGFFKGKPLVVDQSGLFMGVRVFVSDSVHRNLIKPSDLEKQYELFSLDGWGTRAINLVDGSILDFVIQKEGCSYCNYDEPVQLEWGDFVLRRKQQEERKSRKLESIDDFYVGAVTVAERKLLFTRAELSRAELAQRFIKNAGFRGYDNLVKSMSKMKNVSITNKDLENAMFLYGTAPQLKGRSRGFAAPVMGREIPPAMMRKEVTIYVDPFELLGYHSVIVLVRPNSLGLLQPIKTQTQASYCQALSIIMNTLNALKLDVKRIVVDPERALNAAAMSLQGPEVLCVGEGDHVVDAERLTLDVKNITRCSIHGLVYNMPPSMTIPVEKFALSRRNTLYASATGAIPIQTVTGELVDWEKMFANVGFGDMVECYVRPNKTAMMIERTVTAVALYPVGLNGRWRVKYLRTWTEGTSRNFTLIPTTDAHIAFMNAKCEAEKPSIAYRTALKLVREPVDTGVFDNWVDGPAVGEVADVLPIMDESNDGIIEEEEDVEQDVVDVGHAAADAMAALDVLIPDAQLGGEPEMRGGLRSGNNYLVGMLIKGKQVVYVASMKQGATKSTIKKALKMTGEKSKLAMTAAIAELKQIDDKGSWHPKLLNELRRSELKKIVRTFMFVIDKFKPSGELDKVKARLVAMGNMQNPDDIKMDTSAPTVNTSSVMIMACVNAKEDRWVMVCDVGGAFLHALWPAKEGKVHVLLDSINARILCEIRSEYKAFVNKDGTLCMEIDRALYGLVQAARMWYDRLTVFLALHRYVVNACDPCVWNKGSGVCQSTILFHVDDLSCSCRDVGELHDIEKMLKAEFGDANIKCVYGDEQEYLGMLFRYDRAAKVCEVSMKGFTLALLEYAGHDMGKTAKTPANCNLFMLKDDAAKLDEETGKMFHSLVQALSYMAQRCRVDLSTAVGFLKTRVSCSDEFDWQKLERVLCYLCGTVDLCMRLGMNEPVMIDSSIDASHAVYDNGRSQGGLAISVGRGVVKARSHKLDLNTKSSAESELVATSDDVGEVIWAREFLIGQGYDVGHAVVRQDNQAAIRLLDRGRSDSKRTRHINTRFYFVHDRIEKGEIVLTYTRTEEMVADFFTKPLLCF